MRARFDSLTEPTCCSVSGAPPNGRRHRVHLPYAPVRSTRRRVRWCTVTNTALSELASGLSSSSWWGTVPQIALLVAAIAVGRRVDDAVRVRTRTRRADFYASPRGRHRCGHASCKASSRSRASLVVVFLLHVHGEPVERRFPPCKMPRRRYEYADRALVILVNFRVGAGESSLLRIVRFAWRITRRCAHARAGRWWWCSSSDAGK